MAKGIYIAATNQHIGKTTTTLGLITALKKKGFNVGYSKPVGQQWVHWSGKKVDKDAALFAESIGFELVPSIHSPVIIGSGYTATYLEQPEHEVLCGYLDHAEKELHKRHDIVVYEGTGHPGVGSVVNLSNADVAKRMNAGVILVVEGGIGSTIDRLAMCKSLFEQQGVPLLGVFVNKVIPEKLEKVQYYLEKGLSRQGIEILGVIPFEKELAYPMLVTVAKTVKGEVLFGEEHLYRLVHGTIAGSLIDLENLDNDKDFLLVVSIRRLEDALRRLNKVWKQQGVLPNLVGVILTGNAPLQEAHVDFLKEHNIPAIHTDYDTYEAIIKLSRLDVKLSSNAPHKIKRAIELFAKHARIDRICELIKV